MIKPDQCSVCKSTNTFEWYQENIDISKLTFTYLFNPDSNKTFRVVRCRNCTHVFCSPIPKDIYKNYKDVIDNEYIKHQLARELTAQQVLLTIKRYVSSGTLLDVGCATGDFLTKAKEFGYSVEGVELSKWSSEIARKKGHRIYRERLQTFSHRFSGRYDIVTLWGVIEHFENPIQEMKYIKSLLKPGGFIVVWTGDVNGLMSHLLGRRWWYWQGQHIQYFTKKSLNYLAKSFGFQYITTKSYPLIVTYELLDNSLSRYHFRPWIMKMIKPFFIIKKTWFLSLPGEMFWIARKSFKK